LKAEGTIKISRTAAVFFAAKVNKSLVDLGDFMFGVLYMLLSFYIGLETVKTVFPELSGISGWKSLRGYCLNLPALMVVYPASYLVGTLIMTWATYLLSFLFRFTSRPMLYGNIVSLTAFSAASAVLLGVKREKLKAAIIYIRRSLSQIHVHRIKLPDTWNIPELQKRNSPEYLFVLVVFIVSSFLMFYTFSISKNRMFIGLSVWGDFGPHLAVIRSFSWGANFPATYPHFAGGGIRYHFLFQFLAANLEFLGLRIDWAFNIPSILSMVSFLTLLYSFSVVLTGWNI
jgi:hypothetical protein